MRRLILSLFIYGGLFNAQAQNEMPNPFAEFGYTPKMATLSNGKYVEFFDQDTIVQIGGAIFNTNTMKVIGFLEHDTTYSEATMQPEIISRWSSPDPLADEFPSWSPYNYAADNPVYYTDPDGREVKPVNANSRVGLQEAIFNVFNNGQEQNNPIDFLGFDGSKIVTDNIFHKSGKLDKKTGLPRLSKEFALALSKIEDASTKKLIVDFAIAVESSTQNFVDVVTNTEANQTGTNTQVKEFLFYTGNKADIPQNGSSTFIAKSSSSGNKNASLTISATQTINNSRSVVKSQPISTSIDDSKNESREVLKGIVAGDKANKKN